VDQRRQGTASRNDVMETRRGIDMNLTLAAALGSLLLWGLLLFGMHNGSGPVQLLYALGVILLARRILVGAPTFLS
jgi:hypothetical protein